MSRIRSHAQRFAALKREILHLDYFCKGTVLKRMMQCGNQRCACHRDPRKRHGPYWECTYKVHNQTVNLKLYPETMPLYRAAIRQHRRLKSLIGADGRTVPIRARALSPTEVQGCRLKENPGLFS